MRCQPIITSPAILKKLIWVDVKFPLTDFRGDKSGLGKPSKKFFEPDQKMLPIPPNFEKNIALAFLMATWLQVPCWVHFTFKI